HPIRAAFDMDERDLCEFLEHPRVVQIMEWSDWGETVRRGRPLPSILEAALSAGMPVDVHAPGASSRTLAALAAAGAGDCHESLRKEDVLERLRQGFYVPLRHSGLRPDLPELIRAIRATPFGVERLMLTTDGPSPTVLADGFMDRVLQVAMD